MADDLYAPPSSEELASHPSGQDDLYSPPTKEESDTYDPPTKEELAEPDTSAMKDYVSKNLATYQASDEFKIRNPEQHPAKGFWEGMKASLQGSTMGLSWREKMPDTVLPPDADTMTKIGSYIGQGAEVPAMIMGGGLGAIGVGAAGVIAGSEVPVAGNIALGVTGAAAGAAAGSFAVPAAMRKMLVDHYERGDITDAGEFAHRLVATTWEAIKGGITGTATAFAGAAAGPLGIAASEGVGKALGPEVGALANKAFTSPVGGTVNRLASELATMTTMGQALEGRLPKFQDFVDGAAVLGVFHASGLAITKLRNIYANTGEHPHEVIEETERNPSLKTEILSNDPNSPPQAQPTDLVHSSEHSIEIPHSEEQAGVLEKAKQMANESGKKVVIKNAEGEPTEVHPDLENQWTVQPKEESLKLPVPERSAAEQIIASKIVGEPDPTSKTLSQRYQEFRAQNIDKTDPLKRAVEAFEGMHGDLEAEENPHKLMRNFEGNVDKFKTVLEHGFPDADGKYSGDSVNKIFREVLDDDQAGFDLYRVSKRVLDLDSRGIKHGFDLDAAKNVVEDGRAKYDELSNRLDKVKNEFLQYGVDNGLFSQKAVDAATDHTHISFQRLIPEDELNGGEIGKGKIFQKIEGSDLALTDPRLNDYRAMAAIIRRADINDIRIKALDNLAYKDADENFKNDFLREVKLTPGSGIGKNQIAIFRDGKMSALEGTPLVMDSLKRLDGDPTMMDMATKLASKVSQLLRAGTVADPGFGIRHFFRSALMSLVYTQTWQIPFLHTALALGEFMKGTKGEDASEAYKNWMFNGGSVAAIDSLRESYIDSKLQEADKQYSFRDKAYNLIKTGFQGAETFIKMTDNLSRFVEYKRAIEQGKSQTEAAFLSREVTPDYAKAGLQRSALRSSVAFIGAHINSLDRMAQAIKEDPQGTALRLGSLAAISAATWLVGKDDEAIQDLPDYQKDLYWNFHIPNSDLIIKAPKPWGPGILFGSGTERVLDSFFKDNPHAFDGFAHSLYESVIPNLVPTIIAPMLDQYANKNSFSGRPLVNEEQKKELPEMQYQPYTSPTARSLGALIGHVPYVKDIGPSDDPLASPEVVENYIRGWTGPTGGTVLKIADGITRAAKIMRAPEIQDPNNSEQLTKDQIQHTGPQSVESSIADWPIMNEFVSRFPSMKSQPITTFYKNYQDTQKVFNSIRDATRQGDLETAQRIERDYPDYEMRLDGINKTISYGRKAIHSIQYNDMISDPVQKRQLIDSVMFQVNSAAKMGNQMMDDLHKANKGN